VGPRGSGPNERGDQGHAKRVSVDEASRLLGRLGESIRKLVNRHKDAVDTRLLADGYRRLFDLDDIRRLVARVGR
jgi:hypothetical protein